MSTSPLPDVAQVAAAARESARTAAQYDALPYQCDAMPQTHPDLLEVAAFLQGMTPPPADNCSVLEIGCANGANLLPMAALYPRSRFVGLDLSPRQIAEGQAFISELGLNNIELRAADLLSSGDGLAEFDYIVCHGVYSWVPLPVQAAILGLCQRHLSPQGVAYINYNTYPGFHKRQALREMMMYHTASIADPVEAARQGRALLEFLLQHNPDKDSISARLVREELERLRGLPASYLFHEHLEPQNHPYYFHEFMSAATAHGLQFLAEADKSGVDLLPAAAQEALAGLRDDVVRREQYIDFLRNSMLRSTLLCRANIKLQREIDPLKLTALEVRSSSQPKAEIQDVNAPDAVPFSTRFGSVTVEHPAVKALGLILYRARPDTLSIAELTARIAALIGEKMPEAEVCEMVHYAYRIGFVTLRPRRRPLAPRGTERPLATPLARLQARGQTLVSNLWHEPIQLNALERQVLQKLDGNHDSQALTTEFSAALAQAVQPQPLTAILDRFHLVGLLTS